LHQRSSGAAKRKLPEAVRPSLMGRLCPELLINPQGAQQDAMINWGGKARRAGAGSVLRGDC